MHYKSSYTLPSFVLLTTLTFASSFHQDPNIEEAPPCRQEYGSSNLTVPPVSSGYTSGLDVTPCAYANLYVTGSFLYWRASGDYLTFALLDNASSDDPGSMFINSTFNGETVQPHFRFKPAYKVGLGYKFHDDQWDLYAEYTHFYSTTQGSKTANANQHLHPSWLSFINIALIADVAFGELAQASARWPIHLNMVDAEIGRYCFLGSRFIIRPSLGVRNVWLDQKYNITYVSKGSVVIKSLNHSHSWGIGPRGCVEASWNLYKGLQLFGNVGISLLQVKDRVKCQQHNPALERFLPGNQTTFKLKHRINSLRPMLDSSLGLEWGCSFARDRLFFNLQAAYDFLFYWDQGSITMGQMPIVAVGDSSEVEIVIGRSISSQGALTIQGPRLTLRFDF